MLTHNDMNDEIPLSNNIDVIRKKLKKALTRSGIDIGNLKLISKDEFRILYEYGNMFIEIIDMENCKSCSVKEYVRNSECILKPIDETLIKLGPKSLRILYFPKLYSNNITDEDVINIYCTLRDDGYLWEDLRKENLVRDENGNLFLFNYNELTNINDIPINIYQSYIDDHVKRNPDLDKIYTKRKKLEECKNRKNKLLSKIKFWRK